MKVSIGDAAPAWFIVDSGASGCVIDTAVARRLGIKTEGERRASGAGKGTVQVTFAKDISYHLPGASLTVPSSYVIDLSGQRTLQGRDVDGILGYDFFARWVVDLDFESRVMTLREPAGYVPTGNVIPFTLVKKTPHIKVLIALPKKKAVTREVLVDSGSGDAFGTDASGLDVRWADDLAFFIVHDVARDSAAAAAGFKTGDTGVVRGGQVFIFSVSYSELIAHACK